MCSGGGVGVVGVGGVWLVVKRVVVWWLGRLVKWVWVSLQWIWAFGVCWGFWEALVCFTQVTRGEGGGVGGCLVGWS